MQLWSRFKVKPYGLSDKTFVQTGPASYKGRFITVRRAMKDHVCIISGHTIEPGEEYYEIKQWKKVTPVHRIYAKTIRARIEYSLEEIGAIEYDH